MEDIINLDETGIQMMPTWKRTLAEKGAKQVAGVAKKCLAQITKVSAVSATGVLLPYQLIFAGKTERVIPARVQDEPQGVSYTYTATHFANAQTTLEYMQKILVPFIERQRAARIANRTSTEARETGRWAVLIWDNFSSHLNDSVIQCLIENRVKSLPLPPRCTSKYQPLDVLINGAEKRYITSHFSEWYFQALVAAAKQNPPRYDVLPVSSGAKRKFIATLIAAVHSTMAGRTMFLRTAWLKSTLLDTLQERMQEDPNPYEIEDIPLQRTVVRDLLQVTREENREEEIDDDSAELSEITASEDPDDLHQHFNLVTLTMDIDEEDDNEMADQHFAQYMDEDNSDTDFEPPVRTSDLDASSCHSGVTNISMASCGVVNIERPSSGGCVRVTFGRNSPVLSPQQLCNMLSAKFKELKGLVLDSASRFTSDGFDMIVKGAKHGSVAHHAASLTFLPQDLPEAFTRSS